MGHCHIGLSGLQRLHLDGVTTHPHFSIKEEARLRVQAVLDQLLDRHLHSVNTDSYLGRLVERDAIDEVLSTPKHTSYIQQQQRMKKEKGRGTYDAARLLRGGSHCCLALAGAFDSFKTTAMYPHVDVCMLMYICICCSHIFCMSVYTSRYMWAHHPGFITQEEEEERKRRGFSPFLLRAVKMRLTAMVQA